MYEALADHQETAPEQEKPIEFVEYKMPKRESAARPDPPKPIETETPKTETSHSVYTEQRTTTPKEIKVEVETPSYQSATSAQHVDSKSIQSHVVEPLKETIRDNRSAQISTDVNEGLEKLFELSGTDEMSGRFNHVPISSIESAMGLNERIFTLNELFGGDKNLFNATCNTLNNLGSFSEASKMLMSGPAKDFNWSEPERIKMAEQFIRIVSRRYPKSVS